MSNTRLSEDQRDKLKIDLKIEAAIEPGKPISMKRRSELAKNYSVTVAVVSKLITELHLTQQHQWTEEELRDIWCNYESEGPYTLSIRYGVSPKAIIQQVSLMRRCTHNVEKPWLRG